MLKCPESIFTYIDIEKSKITQIAKPYSITLTHGLNQNEICKENYRIMKKKKPKKILINLCLEMKEGNKSLPEFV